MGWLQLIVALAPVIEELLKIAGPEVEALVGKITASPTSTATLLGALQTTIVKAQGGK